MLKFVNTDVTFQEFPDEVALCINISNCPCKCIGCHSSYLAKDIGVILTTDIIDSFISKYSGGITLIGFMGGDDDPEEIVRLAKHIKQSNKVIKVGWYSGRSYLPSNSFPVNLFDYIKLGPYINELGGLSSKKTNQKFFAIKGGYMINETNRLNKL